MAVAGRICTGVGRGKGLRVHTKDFRPGQHRKCPSVNEEHTKASFDLLLLDKGSDLAYGPKQWFVPCSTLSLLAIGRFDAAIRVRFRNLQLRRNLDKT